jgi:ubiquinone/menaquinone biosynthesis C-methylase UbiE
MQTLRADRNCTFLTWKYTDEYYKNYTRETWDACAENYVPLSRQLIPFHKSMLDLVMPGPGERVLDVCTGPGEPAMSIASIIAPSGHVVGVDLSASMTEIATKTAVKRGLRNVEFVTMDAEKLEFPSESFDVAVSCFGFQIVTNPEVAAKEVFRVLKPGGRAGFTVWSNGNRAPAIDVLIGPMLEYATPDENGYLPTPYELGGPGELSDLLTKIGFTDPREIRTLGNFVADSEHAYLSMFLDGSPLGHSLSEEAEDVQKAVRKKAMSNISSYATTKGVSIPAECVIVVASKPVPKATEA